VATTVYWIAQAVFAVAFAALVTSGGLSPATLIASAIIQLGLVGWRLWIARASPWVALVPPTTTVALWYGLGLWAAQEVGGDGRGLLAVMISGGWGVLAYATIVIWAGLRERNSAAT
jgi:hypothetical protein